MQAAEKLSGQADPESEASRRPESEASEKVSALAVIREHTRDLHQWLEASIDMQAYLASRASYAGLLRRYLSVYEPFEALLGALPEPGRAVVQSFYQSKAALLHRDLLALDPPWQDSVQPEAQGRGQSASDSLHQFPAAASAMDDALGRLYVVEGSQLGGQLIVRQVEEKLGLGAESGAAFFTGGGSATGAGWKRFKDLLDANVDIPADAARSASAMFHEFHRALAGPGDGRPA